MHYVIASLTVILQLSPISSYYELIEELGCSDQDFRLQCPPIHAHIVVLEAVLQHNRYLPTCYPHTNTTFQPIDIRHVFNKRCSGRNMCSVALAEDHPLSLLATGSGIPGSSNNSTTEPPAGVVYLRYACMDDGHILKTCSAEVQVAGEGFIQTPGYPKYYVGGRTCQWTLTAPHYQQVVVSLLDISLRGVGPHEQRCLDWVNVTENGLTMLATCGDAQQLHAITSTGSQLNVTLHTASVNLFPKRGLLLHYKGVGCRWDEGGGEAPQDGYIVGRNSSLVHYRCNLGYAFPDSGHRDYIIYCEHYTSSLPLPHCVYVGKQDREDQNNSASNSSHGHTYKMNLTETTAMIRPRGNTNADSPGLYSDIIAPSVIMGLLILGNAVVIAFVYFFKKRLLAAGPDSWENMCPEEEAVSLDEPKTSKPSIRESSH